MKRGWRGDPLPMLPPLPMSRLAEILTRIPPRPRRISDAAPESVIEAAKRELGLRGPEFWCKYLSVVVLAMRKRSGMRGCVRAVCAEGNELHPRRSDPGDWNNARRGKGRALSPARDGRLGSEQPRKFATQKQERRSCYDSHYSAQHFLERTVTI